MSSVFRFDENVFYFSLLSEMQTFTHFKLQFYEHTQLYQKLNGDILG